MFDWKNLTYIVGRNLRNDFVSNFISRTPLLLVLDPDSFEPPFTNGFNEFLYLSNFTSGVLENSSPSAYATGGGPMETTFPTQVFQDYLIAYFSVVFAGFDIIYSILRLCLSAIAFGIFFSIVVFFVIWFVVTLTRRWKLIGMMIRNNDFEGIW